MMLDLPDWARPSIHRVGTGSDAEFTGFDAVGMTMFQPSHETVGEASVFYRMNA